MSDLMGGWSVFLWPLAWKSTVLAGLCWLATRRVWRGSAAQNHLVWTAGAAAMLLLPLLILGLSVGRSFGSAEQWAAGDAHRPYALVTGVEEPATGDPGAVDSRPRIVHVSGEDHIEALGHAETTGGQRGRTLFVIWLAGVVVVASALACGRLGLVRIARGARPARDPALRATIESLLRRTGLHRRARVLVGDHCRVPMTWGLWRTVVLLPATSVGWSEDRLCDVLLHELAHVRRRDTLTQAAAHLVCALFWFNPLVWLMAASMRREREQACDDRVLAGGAAPCDYASHLVELTREIHVSRRLVPAGLALGDPGQLRRRVDALLEDGRCRRDPGPRRTTMIAVLAVAALLPLAAIGEFEEARAEVTTLMATPVDADTLCVDVPGVGPTRVIVLDPDRCPHFSQDLPHVEYPARDNAGRSSRDP